jgi:hypothetical protein
MKSVNRESMKLVPFRISQGEINGIANVLNNMKVSQKLSIELS